MGKQQIKMGHVRVRWGSGRGFSLTVRPDGTLFLNREPTSLEALGERLRTDREKTPDRVVILNADGEVHHRTIVEIMDALRLAGVDQLTIAVAPATQPR